MTGLLYLFTGDGKGKTTAAIGTAVRAAGYGKRAVVVQFLKWGDYGETRCPSLEFYQFGSQDFVTRPTDEDRQRARSGMARAAELLEQQPFLLVLDEVTVAVSLGLLSTDEVLSLVRTRGDTHVILTGRHAPLALTDEADLVTHMCKVKHPYDRGTEGIKGLEF
ncbi:MAG TPA: cob(I)yrinic acid a,c-diamide adenosyltransferase [Thermoplasmatales archaeon]|nr:cob(I)yrinic acid a,c-diamide adenosyltransferase [Thermoplasmatales archaeon]